MKNVETIPTSGILSDPAFRADGEVENVSLNWNEADKTLRVQDGNLAYNLLPYQLYGQCVKKVFLTYNGFHKPNSPLLETVLLESSSEFDDNQLEGYANSNAWSYTPGTTFYNPEIRELTDISQYKDMPYDYSQGFTVVKQFITAGANLGNLSTNSAAPLYTAFYRAPTLTTFLPTNVEHGRIYTDGWYTSYVCAVRTWEFKPENVMQGDIIYYPLNNTFYLNLTGQVGNLVLEDPNDPESISIPDTMNWSNEPTFEHWKELMRRNITAQVNIDSPIYFIESQHLVLAEINQAIKKELQNNCSVCHKPDYNMTALSDYIRLNSKRIGAVIKFNEGFFHEASHILKTARSICHMCLYHKECLTTSSGRC
jgi:hypothetical protein